MDSYYAGAVCDVSLCILRRNETSKASKTNVTINFLLFWGHRWLIPNETTEQKITAHAAWRNVYSKLKDFWKYSSFLKPPNCIIKYLFVVVCLVVFMENNIFTTGQNGGEKKSGLNPLPLLLMALVFMTDLVIIWNCVFMTFSPWLISCAH